eukprot:CAMPEP_0202891084 /NCGR_PEP_ID=MMETSP1392-20130828/1261_1 /ASSEMBLY_ACC=CAM_ASM_000868 /TAXON_ID=225041 /ORGANISM="Chlamydomonas chlamydogama, Strain SAG 11-48b" /LENGTH=303 /DNA_ID=CAMNT_0049574759 /DNA_START=55 /DNA_END=966 /DNA_ORIENTATION=+
MTNKLWHTFVTAGGNTTEVFGIDACDGAEVQVVIIPGNPGSALFYHHFVELLDEALENKADIRVISHLNHDLHAKGELVPLEDQVTHKAAYLREHVLLPNRPPVILLCHSIGAYMTLHALGKQHLGGSPPRNAPPILKVVCMFPFLEADFSVPRARRLRRAAAHHNLLGMVASILSWVPDRIKCSLFQMFAKDTLEPHALEACCQLLQYRTVRQYFYLATQYILERPFDWGLLAGLGKRVLVMTCPHDTWMPWQILEKMRQRVPGIQVRWDEDMSHAFIVSTSRCDKAALLLADIVTGVLRRP